MHLKKRTKTRFKADSNNSRNPKKDINVLACLAGEHVEYVQSSQWCIS